MKISIPTPSRLTIGDPWYRENPPQRVKELIFESKFPKTFVSSLSIKHDEESEEYAIKICIAPNNKILALYEEDKYLEVFNHKKMLLGCDTACFEIETPEKYVHIGTMADGCFGDAHRFTYNRKCQGAIINIFLCEAAFDERIQREIEYVFTKEGNRI